MRAGLSRFKNASKEDGPSNPEPNLRLKFLILVRNDFNNRLLGSDFCLTKTILSVSTLLAIFCSFPILLLWWIISFDVLIIRQEADEKVTG